MAWWDNGAKRVAAPWRNPRGTALQRTPGKTLRFPSGITPGPAGLLELRAAIRHHTSQPSPKRARHGKKRSLNRSALWDNCLWPYLIDARSDCPRWTGGDERHSKHNTGGQTLQLQVSHLADRVDRLERRAEDTEGRNRRKNICIVRLPEGIEGSNTVEFLESWLQTLMDGHNLTPFFALERAYRLPVQRPQPGRPPRPVVAKLLHLMAWWDNGGKKSSSTVEEPERYRTAEDSWEDCTIPLWYNAWPGGAVVVAGSSETEWPSSFPALCMGGFAV
ncbi:hypothetical protein NDU88_005825 [Pleurodeles waltl]|uniref:Uncharacterized protein n=1 Tax=Pleurodeles waltl TaxID=8319 RepID=A0AAV7ME17_PLEWA|nr:hypothetical protein NDU88_005825 [Pleurodeles waltl]